MDIERPMTRRDFLRGFATSAAALAVTSCMPITPDRQPANIRASIQPILTGNPASETMKSIDNASLVHFTEAGSMHEVPEVVVERLGTPNKLEVKPLPPRLKEVFDSVVNETFPYLHQIVDEVVVLEHPQKNEFKEGMHVDTTKSIMVGISSLERVSNQESFTPNNTRKVLYFFLPDYLLNGGNPDITIQHYSMIPYSKAGIPNSLLGFFEWTALHEITHLADYSVRLDSVCPVLYGKSGSCVGLENVLENSANFDSLVTGTRISTLLGMENVGLALQQSDEDENNGNKVRKGNTLYTRILGGAFGIDYDDGTYKFRYGFVRQGFIPEELKNLTDVAPIIRSGKFPRLYAYFEPDHERFAEFSAWYLYNKRRGKEQDFTTIHPELTPYFDSFFNGVKQLLPQEDLLAHSGATN